MKYNDSSSGELHQFPAYSRNWALFLDVDGTLLDFAARPSDVSAQPDLLEVIASLARRVPLALVSGRRIKDLDRLFAPLVLPTAGQHGAERRSADGHIFYQLSLGADLQPALDAVNRWAHSKPGVFVEDKGFSFALHYRLAPELKDVAEQVARQAIKRSGGSHVIVPGNMVWEVRPAVCDKGRAIAAFLAEKPFVNRIPVFIGDDIGDEDGFRLINESSGYSFKVGKGETAAQFCLSDVGAVLAWLQHYVTWLEEDDVDPVKKTEVIA